MKINARALWNSDIRTPNGLDDLLEELFKDDPKRSLVPARQFTVADSSPPLFFYVEYREKDNYVRSYTYYGGGGSPTAIMGFGTRSVLNLNTKYINNAARGEVLNAFCCLEFVLDVLICVSSDVFSGKISYAELALEYRDEPTYTGKFSSVAKKVKYLIDNGYISKRTYDLMLKSKSIRNALAHQYLPVGNFGVTDKDIVRYETISNAIETIFNAAWFYLLTDYNERQIEVASWLAKNKSVI